MRVKVSLTLLVLGAMLVLSLFGAASADSEYTTQVIPRVDIDSGGSLSIVSGTTGLENNLIDFGHLGPGTTITRTLTLGVTANDDWTLMVSKSRDLKDDTTDETVHSSNFTFTSNGAVGPVYASADTEFGTEASPATVVSSGLTTSNDNVNVVYKLHVSDEQPAGYYTAPYHTYTLIVSGP